MTCCLNDSPKMRQERYVVIGDPIPLARPRFARGRVFDSQARQKITVQNQLFFQQGCKPRFTGPVHVEVTFFMSMPRASKKKMESMDGAYHFKRPDFSNLLKFIEDAAHEVVYDDDCIISYVCGSKVYSYNPRTEFIITEIRDGSIVKER